LEEERAKMTGKEKVELFVGPYDLNHENEIILMMATKFN